MRRFNKKNNTIFTKINIISAVVFIISTGLLFGFQKKIQSNVFGFNADSSGFLQKVMVGDKLVVAQVSIQKLQDQNKVLKNLLKKQGVSYASVLPNTSVVRITSASPVAVQGILKGVIFEENSKALLVGRLVLDGKGNALGLVSEQDKHKVTIEAFSKSKNQVTALHVSSGSSITLTGVGNGGFTAKVPKEVPVKPGDVLLEQFPTSRVIAIVEKVNTDSRNPLQTVYAQSSVNIQSVGFVLVEGV